jgi:hypothetical protein
MPCLTVLCSVRHGWVSQGKVFVQQICKNYFVARLCWAGHGSAWRGKARHGKVFVKQIWKDFLAAEQGAAERGVAWRGWARFLYNRFRRIISWLG